MVSLSRIGWLSLNTPSGGRHIDGVTVQDWLAVTEHRLGGDTVMVSLSRIGWLSLNTPYGGRHSDGVTVQDWLAVTKHSVWGETLSE